MKFKLQQQLSAIKNLANQTLWYGLSTMAVRLLNYLLTPYLTYKFTTAQYGEMSILYAFIPFMNIIFMQGMETSFFRFIHTHSKKEVVNTLTVWIFSSALILAIILLQFTAPLNRLLQLAPDSHYLHLCISIIFLDTLSSLAFVQLRADGKPRFFAAVKLSSILVYMGSIYFFLSYCPQYVQKNPLSFIGVFYRTDYAVGYVLWANLFQALFTCIFLAKYLFNFEWKFDMGLWKKIMLYSLPLILIGFGGMINETLDRIMLTWLLPAKNQLALKEVGIYSACYKLSIFISLATQAFRMGAEPFFFKQAADKNAPVLYARVMKFFVIVLCAMFLIVVLYLPVLKYFIANKAMWVGLEVVPVLLIANIFLGVYYNLSVWYKLSNQTMAGVWITLFGVLITIAINYFGIPAWGYKACAWATFFCYGGMMVISYLWGQKKYYIPYAWKKLLAYLVIAIGLYAINKIISGFLPNLFFQLALATLLFFAYLFLLLKTEYHELKKIGFFKRWGEGTKQPKRSQTKESVD